MNTTPFILVTTVFTVAFCVQLAVVSLLTDHAESTEGSQGHETEKPIEKERFLSRDGGHVASPGQDDQPRSSRDHTVDHSNHENAERTKEIETARKDVKKLQEDLFTSQSRNAELQRQCETLSRGLEGARLFLNTADTFADSDIIQVLQKLNAELQHIATIMADHVVDVLKFDAMTSDPEQQVVKRASENIGSTLVNFMRTMGLGDSKGSVYLQIAFQAYLTKHLCWIASSWALDEGHSTFVNEIYQRLRDTEAQPISALWRSLTRANGLPPCVNDSNALVIPLVAGLSDILLIAGCSASQSHIMPQFSSTFKDKISSAVLLARNLNQMIGGVISGDFEVFVARPGETFRGETMEDMDGSGEIPGGTETARTVLCTSEIGLMKRVQLETGARETRTVVKAKVILESFLETEDSG